MNQLGNEVTIMKSSISKKIWSLKDKAPEEFKRQVREYFARGYPGWTVIRAQYPFIYLRDDRKRV